MFYFTIEKDFQKVFALINNKYNTNLNPTIKYSDFDTFDYQSSVFFNISKHPQKSDIIDTVIHALLETEHYKKVEITGKGFLSLSIDVDKCLEEDGYTNEQLVIVDYCGVNVAKKMHIGHIRSMFLGDYISNHYEHLGHKVIRMNHIGDWGNQFGYLLNYIETNKLNIETNAQLTDIYKKAYSFYCENTIFAEKSNLIAQKLQNYEEPYLSLWKKCCDISIKEMNKITEEFGLKINSKDILGESFYAPYLPEIEKILLDSKILSTGSDGSIVYKTDKGYPLMLKKSNGSYLYAMYDIAALYYRISKFDPDQIIYVVDKRQSDHFKAIFELVKKLNWSDCKLEHFAFGFIIGEDGKPLKTKSGENLYLDELIEAGKQQLITNDFYKNLPEGYKEEVIKKTLYGSLKWFDLRSNPSSDYQFNWNNILSNNSGTASYIFHAYARIDSLLYQQDNHGLSLGCDIKFEQLPVEAIDLYKKSQILNETLFLLCETHSCNNIEEKLLDVVKSFHFLYEKININNSNQKTELIGLLNFVKLTIEDTCHILGLEPYKSQIVWSNSKEKKLKI